MDELQALVAHLVRTTRLRPDEARRVVDEVIAFFSEAPADFIVRRHAELHRAGLGNAEIYATIGRELEARRFGAPKLSERQIRRVIYG